jgi:hypothetical protein
MWASRATVIQQKTSTLVQFEMTQGTRDAVCWVITERLDLL